MQYILSNSDNGEKGSGCIFCDFPKLDEDEKHLILHRGKLCFVIMNAFPYNPGHLMVVPYRHTADFPGLSAEELAEMMSLSQTCHKVLTNLMQPHGFNMGMNLGKVAGAGIDAHLTGERYICALQDYQLRKINETLTYARQNTSFYRQHLAFL